MYVPIPEVSPGAKSVNEAIRHARAVERSRVIDRAKRLSLSARLARIADREGVIGPTR